MRARRFEPKGLVDRARQQAPVFAHLALVLLLGLYIPAYLVDWYRRAAQLIG